MTEKVKTPSLAEQVKATKAKLLEQLKAAGETYAEFSTIRLTGVLSEAMFKDALAVLGLQPIDQQQSTAGRELAQSTGRGIPKEGTTPAKKTTTKKGTYKEELVKDILAAVKKGTAEKPSIDPEGVRKLLDNGTSKDDISATMKGMKELKFKSPRWYSLKK